MCFSAPKAPTPTTIVAPPKPAETAMRIESSKDVTDRQTGDKPKADVRKFDLQLPASFTIPF